MLSEALAYTVTEENVNITVKKVYWRGVAIEVKAADTITYNDYSKAMKKAESWKDKGISLVSVGTEQSNCHSYAWLKGLFPDKYQYYWLNDVPAELINECIVKNEPVKGYIAYKPQHSAIVVDKIGKNEFGKYDPIVISKWGAKSIFKGPMSAGDCAMYDSEVKYYWYRASTK